MLITRQKKFFQYSNCLIAGALVSVSLSACARQSGPVNAFGDVTVLYKVKTSPKARSGGSDNQTYTYHQFRLRANVGNPQNPALGEINYFDEHTNKFYNLKKLQDSHNQLMLNKVNLFTPIVTSALKYQINAIIARTTLTRSYYSYLFHKLGNTVAVNDTGKAMLQTYFGKDEDNAKLFAAEQASTNKESNRDNFYDDAQFAFYYANLLKQGNGFGNSPYAINFGLESVVVDLGDLSEITFPTDDKTPIKYTPTNTMSSGTTDPNVLTVQSGDNKTTQKYWKFHANVYYNFGFSQNNQPVTTADPFKNYFQAQGNSDLVPKALQMPQHYHYNVKMSNMMILSAIGNDNVLLNPQPDYLTWANVSESNKLLDNSLIKLSSLIDSNARTNVANLSINQSTFDHFFTNKLNFPNSNPISLYANRVGAFNVQATHGFDWKDINKLKTTDLLFSFFQDFKLKADYSGVEKQTDQATNAHHHWLSYQTLEELMKSIKTPANSPTVTNKAA